MMKRATVAGLILALAGLNGMIAAMTTKTNLTGTQWLALLSWFVVGSIIAIANADE